MNDFITCAKPGSIKLVTESALIQASLYFTKFLNADPKIK